MAAETQNTEAANSVQLAPFYERWTPSLPGKVGLAFALGLLSLGPHALRAGRQVFQDWSWFLAVLVTTAALCLFYATHTFRTVLRQMPARFGESGIGALTAAVQRYLSDRKFVLAGVAFGLMNCAFGSGFGVPADDSLGRGALLWGYFIAGFVSGMAAYGIYGVSATLAAYTREADPAFDLSAPDRCGGALFLGEALTIFSSVTLLVGVMISVYILKADWNSEDAGWVLAMKCFWIAFPYAMSLMALLAPAAPVNRELTSYKMKQETIVRRRLEEIKRRLEDERLEASERQGLREDYEFQKGIREDLYKMRTWPYGLGANLRYGSVVAGHLAASFDTVSKWTESAAPFAGG